MAILSNGLLVSKTGLYTPWYFAGGILTIIGGALLYTIALDDMPARIYGFGILLALGGGAFTRLLTQSPRRSYQSSVCRTPFHSSCARRWLALC